MHAQDVLNSDAVSGLFEGLAQRRFVGLLARFHAATGQRPEGAEVPVFGHPVGHEQLTLLNDDRVGRGSGFH